jgi:hypothetical protein
MNENKDISPAQTKTLVALWTAGGACPDWKDAYKAASVDGRTIPALVRSGLVKYVHPENRMNWKIEITPAGIAYLMHRNLH